MHDEFFGHCIAGLRFGGTLSQFLKAVEIAFEIMGSRHSKEVSHTPAHNLSLLPSLHPEYEISSVMATSDSSDNQNKTCSHSSLRDDLAVFTQQ